MYCNALRMSLWGFMLSQYRRYKQEVIPLLGNTSMFPLSLIILGGLHLKMKLS